MPINPPTFQQFKACAMMRAGSFSVVLVAALFGRTVAAQEVASMDAARRAEIVRLVRQDCGSCHGLTLNGGLGPALLPQTLKDKPVDNLTFVIMQGRPGTAMPPWKRFLTETEAQWIVVNLQKGFPSEH